MTLNVIAAAAVTQHTLRISQGSTSTCSLTAVGPREGVKVLLYHGSAFLAYNSVYDLFHNLLYRAPG